MNGVNQGPIFISTIYPFYSLEILDQSNEK